MKKILLAWMLLCAPAMADESKIVLKDAPGRDVVVANCSTCHSLDYIPVNSVFLDRKGWEGSVNKMIKVMGAPIKDDDVQKIIDYLAGQYGK
jgi:mono/diheme cytochrome c family protein